MEDDLGLADRCVGKLACFRVKELKDVLTQLHLPKQGRKQDLMDRIISFLYDEETPISRLPNKNISGKKAIADVIDDIYRKMDKTEASDLATTDEGGKGSVGVVAKEEDEDVSISKVPIRCPCGSPVATEFMIQCVDPDCQVQQHFCCVIILEKPTDSIPSLPPKFYCEMCRIKRSDPFWESLVHLFYPVKLPIADIPTDGTNPLQFVEKTFQLSRADSDYLQDSNYDVQAWCILLNDNVPFRMQWPQYSSLQVNGVAVRTVNRPGSQLLGANGRDDGALIKLHIKEGVNNISLSGCDSRVFCFGLRLVRRRTVQQVLNLIPKETDGELFEEALSRVRRCTGGGMATANEDSDSDLEVIADSIMVNLRCPLSGSRIKVAGRFKPCAHMGCFDLGTFVELSQRSRKWQCPICLKNYSVEDIIIDPYFNRITTLMQHCGEDITEIDLKPDGSWSARTNGESSDLAQWHLPDGSITAANTIISNLEFSTLVRQTSQFITMSNGASGSSGDVEDPSIIQVCSGQIDMSTSNGNDIDSIPHNFDPACGVSSRNLVTSGEADIIFLSDSEEENYKLVSPTPACPTGPVNDNNFDLTLDVGLSSSLDLLNGNGGDTGLSHWPYPFSARSSSGLQLFGTDSDIADAFTDLEHTSVACSGQMNGHTLTPRSTVNSSVSHTNTDDMDEALINNSLPFVGEDPSLRSFLPSQPAAVSVESGLRHQPAVPNVTDSADWISLKLGNNGVCVEMDTGAHPNYTSTGSLNVTNQYKSEEAALQVDVNNEDTRSNKTSTSKISDGPFSFPRQPRSARRVYLSVDSDSE